MEKLTWSQTIDINSNSISHKISPRSGDISLAGIYLPGSMCGSNMVILGFKVLEKLIQSPTLDIFKASQSNIIPRTCKSLVISMSSLQWLSSQVRQIKLHMTGMFFNSGISMEALKHFILDFFSEHFFEFQPIRNKKFHWIMIKWGISVEVLVNIILLIYLKSFELALSGKI